MPFPPVDVPHVPVVDVETGERIITGALSNDWRFIGAPWLVWLFAKTVIVSFVLVVLPAQLLLDGASAGEMFQYFWMLMASVMILMLDVGKLLHPPPDFFNEFRREDIEEKEVVALVSEAGYRYHNAVLFWYVAIFHLVSAVAAISVAALR